jgi:hypothetical protein
MPEVKSRHVDMKNPRTRICASSWTCTTTPGTTTGASSPFTERELSKMAADLKLIAFPELSYITEIDGEPAAVALACPT